MNKIKIKQLTVKIYNKGGGAIGSGTLYVPKGNGKHAYVFTAAHVAVKGLDAQYLGFKMLVDQQEMNFETKEDDAIKLHDKFDKDADIKTYDVAIIKIIKEDWMQSLPILTIGNPREDLSVEGRGFPSSAREDNLKFAIMPLNGQIGTCSDQDQRFHLILANKLTNPSEELPGYSGSGLFEERDEATELVLIGIFSYGQGKNAIQNTTNAFYSSLLQDICKQYGLEEPEEANQAPSSFEPYILDAISMIENDTVRENIHQIIKYIIETGIKPSGLINTEDGIHDIPQCNSRDRVRCKMCWVSRLRLISILAMIEGEISNPIKPSISLDEKFIPIEFFCSEGSEGNSQIGKVVRSIFNKGFAWENKFREDAILVWASIGNQTHKDMTRTEFSRLIEDICNEQVNRMKKYDTMYGEGKNNNLSIIHIDKLMTAIDVRGNKDVKNSVLEVLEDVIS